MTITGIPSRIASRTGTWRKFWFRSIASWRPSRVDLLFEIAVSIKQRNADEREAEVARRLCVIAGENAQAAGIDRDRFVEAEFRREVGHRSCGGKRRGMRAGPHVFFLDVAVEFAHDRVDDGEEVIVLGERFEPGLSEPLKHLERAVVGQFPKVRIEVPEEPPGAGIP